MRKCLLILFTVLLVITLCSCSISELMQMYATPKTEETVTPYETVEPDDLTYSEGYEPVTSSYSYEALPLEGEKQLYTRMLDVCYDISPEKDSDTERYPMPQVDLEGYSLSEAQVRTVSKALTDDHPEIFWTTGTIGYYSDEESTSIQMYSIYSPDEVSARVNAVRSAANSFYATVPDGLSPFERELMVHDYLIDNVAYDNTVDTVNLENNPPEIYTVYGALVDQVAVCEGYARAFQMLLNGLGVDCVGMFGESENQMHMWNAVKLGESWYQTDVTWDDQEESYARYIYFNVTDDFMLYDHTFSELFSELSDADINGETDGCSANVMNMFRPPCAFDDMGYYVQKSPCLSDYDGAQVKSGLLSAAEKQEEYFVFYVDESMDYDTAVGELFVDYPQYFFGYLTAVNNSLSDYSIDSSNLGYFTHDRSRMIAVELHYY